MAKGIHKQLLHPQAYQALLWLALAFGLHSPLLILISIPLILLEFIMTMAEETDLVIRYGKPYLEYRDKTGMFFPKEKNTFNLLSKTIGALKVYFNID